ncbi:MAG: glycoside hydrolase family 2 protein, partial [Muribaculaceae bacterium]|nr:glycoside hydrolase family 2 protein [Muribaculaceae bacterium]
MSYATPFLSAKGEITRQNLDYGWKFRQARQGNWHKAKVPGEIHTDLMRAGLIEDPFIGQNERKVQWVDKEDWIYETTFATSPDIARQENIDLIFKGLDTYADVYLNDSLILRADNMFREWAVPVKNILKDTDNTLRILFHSPIKTDLPKFDKLDFRYEAVNDQSENGGIFDKQVSVFARKAGYHYGWDWGPRLVTSGIWRPIILEGWSGLKIDDVFIETQKITPENAEMKAFVSIENHHSGEKCRLELIDASSNGKLASKEYRLKNGINNLTLPFNITEPKLWWCNGLGEPHLYDIQCNVIVDKDTVAQTTVSTGVRTIEVVREKDSEGISFFFKLNGIPVFAKGANYIPCDNFLSRVTKEVYEKTIQDAVDVNMNMLRVWGGGIYEDDYFYELCDKNGIMVWQDFMFACSLYPAEGEMLDNIRYEAIDNVKRLRNHPSIALWCGNNECLEAWHGWSWKKRYTQQGVDSIIWNQYDNLFHKVLPEVVAQHSPKSFYWPSSPFSRYDGIAEPNNGDFHLWTVWGQSKPIDDYNHIRSRFFSEYGFQSFPTLETVKTYAPDPDDWDINSEVMLSHQRGGAEANNRIKKYLDNAYPQPKDFESLLYMTQILQGDAIRTAIEAHRRDKPYCMGSLFWQHNDCWPVASWSSRDYYGNWKAQHYYARKAFDDILLSC